jgi:GNAT superfamily N-acetyltransferase
VLAPATIDDARDAATLKRTVFPESLSTPAGVAHGMGAAPPWAYPLHLKAERHGQLVGWGWAGLDWLSARSTDALAGVIVHPAHRGRGIGSALWGALDAHLGAIGATVVRGQGDGTTAPSFAEPRRFRQTAVQTILALDVTTVETAPAPPSGVCVMPFTAFDAERERLFAVDVATVQDEPGDYDFGGMTFADWERETFGHPNFDPELSAVVCVDGEPVGTSLVYADHESGRAVHGGMGILREQRGRGLGLLLKQHVTAWARDAGVVQAFTANDESNAPMLAINRRLGYALYTTRTSWRRD